MKPDTPIKELDALRKEKDALDQSVALNRIVMTMLESKRREDFWLRVILIISLLANIAIAGIFAWYESGWTTTATTTTVTQDTGEGSGNNVYQAGENANYIQGNSEEVTPNGETNSDNYNGDQNTDIQQQEHGSNSETLQSIG
nr:MAG TPA: NICKEL AND COBALT RESISTANCE PROTEIN BINDING PROTEIN, SENSOR PROTEIN [Caudoviricetes sp.]